MQESMVFYHSFYDAIKMLEPDVKAEIYDVIFAYALEGVEPKELSPTARLVFTLIRPQLDANTRRRESAGKGGRPSNKKETDGFENEKPMDIKKENHRFSKKETIGFEKEKPNVNVNDNVNVNENENVNARARAQETLSAADVFEKEIQEEEQAQEVIRVAKIFADCGIYLQPMQRDELQGFLKHGMQAEALELAAKKAMDKGVFSWAYPRTILNGWLSKGILTADAVGREDAEFARKKVEKKPRSDPPTAKPQPFADQFIPFYVPPDEDSRNDGEAVQA